MYLKILSSISGSVRYSSFIKFTNEDFVVFNTRNCLIPLITTGCFSIKHKKEEKSLMESFILLLILSQKLSTMFFENNTCRSSTNGRMNKRMIMQLDIRVISIIHSIPHELLDANRSFQHMIVFGHEVIAQQNSKILRWLYAVLFGQQVDNILLRVRGDDVRIVTLQVIFLRWQCKSRWDFKLLNDMYETYWKYESTSVDLYKRCALPFLTRCKIFTPSFP